MIQRFRFGLPLPTDSVVQEIPVSAGPVPFLTAEEDGWAYRMAPDAIVYGLGEMPRPAAHPSFRPAAGSQ